MENDLSAEELSTPVTITRGELNQLSHAFNNYQAMAEQVQSLAIQIAQLRFLMATPARTPEPSTIRVAAPSQVKSPRSSSLTHLPGTDWNSTPTSLVVNLSS